MSFYGLYQAINICHCREMEGGEEYWSQGKKAQNAKKKEREKQGQIPLT